MSELPYPKRRDQLVNVRRQQILSAASSLFAEKGFHRTTTKEIAETAGVSEGTLYNYFISKEDMLIGIVEQLAEAQVLETGLAQSLPLDARSFLEFVLKNRRNTLRENDIMLQAVLSEIMADQVLREQFFARILKPTLAALENHLLERAELGHIRPVNARRTVRILLGMVYGLFMLQSLGDPLITEEWDALAEDMSDLVFQGLGIIEKT